MARVKKIILISIVSLLLFNSCRKDPGTNETNNLNGNIISAFGHAGMGMAFKYPGNSYESIEPCLRIGSDGVEMDIQMSKDSVLIAFHSGTLQEVTLCQGRINDKLWSEIWGCHYTSPYSSKINVESVNSLFDRLQGAGYNLKDYMYSFDCKLLTTAPDPIAFYDQHANAILRIMDERGLQDNILIESSDTTFLRILQTKRSGLKLFIYQDVFEKALALGTAMQLFGIIIRTDYITEAEIKRAHDNGLRVMLWGAQTKNDNVDMILKSPDYIQSDKIIHLLKIFGKYKYNINKGEGG